MHESTPGAAAGRECEVNGDPSRTAREERRMGEEEKVVSLFFFFPRVTGCTILHLLANLMATLLTVIYNSLLNHNANVRSLLR